MGRTRPASVSLTHWDKSKQEMAMGRDLLWSTSWLRSPVLLGYTSSNICRPRRTNSSRHLKEESAPPFCRHEISHQPALRYDNPRMFFNRLTRGAYHWRSIPRLATTNWTRWLNLCYRTRRRYHFNKLWRLVRVLQWLHAFWASDNWATGQTSKYCTSGTTHSTVLCQQDPCCTSSSHFWRSLRLTKTSLFSKYASSFTILLFGQFWSMATPPINWTYSIQHLPTISTSRRHTSRHMSIMPRITR